MIGIALKENPRVRIRGNTLGGGPAGALGDTLVGALGGALVGALGGTPVGALGGYSKGLTPRAIPI